MRHLLLIGIGILHLVTANPNAENVTSETLLVSAQEDEAINPLLHKKYPANAWLSREANGMVAYSAHTFSSKLLKEFVKNAEKNFICSPIGVSTLLSMACYGARRYTELMLRWSLQLPSLRYLGKIGFQNLIDRFDTYKEAELHMANGIFVDSSIEPNPDFIETTTRAFRSGVQSLDFANATEASDVINAWFEKKTNERIKSVVAPDDLRKGASLVLVNAMYFKGTWQTAFDPELTIDRTFYVNGVTETQVPSMEVTASFPYGILEQLNAAYIQLPYKSEDAAHRISMLIILPNERDGLAELERNIDKISVLELFDNGESNNVRLVLPKFKIESEIDLKGSLEQLGLNSLFKRADFTGIVRYPPLYVSKIVQKAVIEIDENGSEAAAATGAIVNARMFSHTPIEFIADHPFIAIIATNTHPPVNLFTARYNGRLNSHATN